ncbi:RAD9, HUS1, RAD1-interacting nuclear orphan protein 1 [Engystomops pustulosus]|uniref:RAD9, HUS1, RAD1-interacting nuclear orphan protein 1 n=1 Tax=Engystomops pustulosus TaxID=76066 RepID=UPI003AFA6AD5
MPPRKRTACNPRKPRLVFLESPQEGPVHEYGAAPPKAETKCVPVRPLDHDASTSWVSPQFDRALELHFPARQRRRRHVSNNSTVHSRPGNRSQNPAAGRKPSVCKFPSLSFSSTGISQTESFCTTRRRPRQNVAVPTPVPASPPSPPDIRTPETSVKRSPGLQTPLSRRWEEAGDAPETPLADSPERVLAEDTPEHEYGMRPTWRRRPGLMKYLKSRGRLKSSQILVQSETDNCIGAKK